MSTVAYAAVIISGTDSDVYHAFDLIESPLDEYCSEVIEGSCNNFASFYIGPSGSTLGRPRYDAHTSLVEDLLTKIQTLGITIDVHKLEWGDSGLACSARY